MKCSMLVHARRTMCIPGEVARHPVKYNAEARLMAGVDEVALEMVRRAVRLVGAKKPVALVAPRPAERMLEHRQQPEMHEFPMSRAYGAELLGQLPVGQRAVPSSGTRFHEPR